MSSDLATSVHVKFGDMAILVREKVDPVDAETDRYVGLEHLDPGSLRIRRWGTTNEVTSTKIRFRPGDIIFGKRRAYQRKLAVASFHGICSAHAMVLRAKTNVVLSEFLPYFMQSDVFMDRAIKISVGGLSPTINWSDLAREEFVVPPLGQQRRIAPLLQGAEAACETMRSVGESARTTYLAALLEMFRPALRAEPGDSIAIAQNGETWEWRRVDEMFSVQLGKMSSKKARKGDRQASYVKNNNVQWDRVDLDDLPQMSFDDRERRKYSLRQGDLLVCEGGEIGRAAVWREDRDDVFYQKALHRLRPIHPEASTSFFMHYLRACAVAGILARVATGGTIAHLPRERLAGLRLPFPTPREQSRILDVLTSLNGASEQAERRADALGALASQALLEGLAP